ncbi:MAG: hypothetical protein ACI9VM_000394 [Candidatus Azotimanducaceae bacterium]|jgi:hypothetical protein
MIPEYFAGLGIALEILGGLYYLYCTIKGSVRPNRVTYFFWTVIPMIAFAAQIVQGVGLVAWMTFAAGLTPLLILIASTFNPDAFWKTRKIDFVFAGIAIVGLILWYITDNPNFAITFAILAEIAVVAPTLVKTYQFPETEAWASYGLSLLGYGLVLLSIQTWTYENYAFVTTLFVTTLLITVFALRKPSEERI